MAFRFMFIGPRHTSSFLLCWCLLAGILGCDGYRHAVLSSSSDDTWRAWQILEANTGRLWAYGDWINELERSEIVYLGEEHYNPHHIEAAIRLLSSLMADGLRPALGMEMFGWDGQDAMDRYLSHEGTERGVFLDQAKWASNWGGAYENYEPLVLFAKDRRVPIRAMNPPKTLIRRVVKLGLTKAQAGTEWQQWGLSPEDIIDDPDYRAKILDQLRRCHGGGAETDYQSMYDASMVRDEGMAQTVVSTLKGMRQEPPARGPLVLSYTGGGHIQYNLPVPRRVARRLAGSVRQTTVYLASFDPTRAPEIRELLQEHIADFIWLTPMGPGGPVQRCR
ncbi:MAG: ChaN family lipoprotein [Nitrospiraceae bacterium]|nr:ChaN family lipoprotein [Nitrospiraceae bacterium]